MTIAQTWVSAAYTRSAANDAGKLAQDPELLDHVNRVYQRFFALFAKARPDEASSTASWVLSGSPAFYTIPTDTIALVSLHNAAGAEVHLIPANEVQRLWHLPPCMTRVGYKLASRNKGGDPVATNVLTVQILDAPAPITSLASTIDARFPTRHHQLCIDSLALYLDTKDDGRSTEEHAKIVAEYQTALSTFVSEYNLPPDAVEWAHAPVSRSAVSA